MDCIPFYVKSGSIVPLKLVKRRSTSEMAEDPISLRIFIDKKTDTAKGQVYLDDGKSYDFIQNTASSFLHFKYDNGKISCASDLLNFQGPQIDQIELIGIGGGLVSNAKLNTGENLEIVQGKKAGEWVIKAVGISITRKNWSITLDIIG
jgi:hypothetical protein